MSYTVCLTEALLTLHSVFTSKFYAFEFHVDMEVLQDLISSMLCIFCVDIIALIFISPHFQIYYPNVHNDIRNVNKSNILHSKSLLSRS